MRFIVSLYALLFSSICLAYPAVGDMAHYAGYGMVNGTAYEVEFTETLTEYNASTNMFKKVSTTVVKNHSNKTTEEWLGPDKLLSPEIVNYLLNNCSQKNGVLEYVSVPAGNFNTCKLNMKNDEGTVNVGNVPFGIIKAEKTNDWAFELVTYNSGY